MNWPMRIVVLAVLPLLLMAGPVLAEETPELELTLEEAVERALTINHLVRRAGLEREIARQEKQEAVDNLRDFYVALTPETEEAHTRASQAEINYLIKSKQEEGARRDIITLVVEKYGKVLIGREKAAAAQQGLNLAQWQHNAAEKKYSLGMLSLNGLRQAENNLEEARAALDCARQELNKAYTDFNTLVGLGAESRPHLVSELPYAPLEIKSMTAEINRALDSSRDLWAAERFISLKRLDLRRYFIPSYDIAEMELELAEMDAERVREELKRQVQLFVDEILSLEEAVAGAAVQVKKAEESLQEAGRRQAAGLAAKGDVMQIEVARSSARAALAELQCRHAILMAAYRNLTGREILSPPAAAAIDADQDQG